MKALLSKIATEPVAVLGGLVTLFTVFLAATDATGLITGHTRDWLGVIGAVITAAATIHVRAAVTPTADPKAADGTPLTPAGQ